MWNALADQPDVTALAAQAADGDAAGRLMPYPLPLPPCGSAQYGLFVPTTWGQCSPYNDELLFDGFGGQYCQTGCVATAMAQIMYYWHYLASY